MSAMQALDSARLLVGVMTCRANRERERAVRRTWLAAPPPTGIAVIFVEGDGDPAEPPRFSDQRLTLPVPDAYELLPRKTQAFFRWAIANTSCDHIFKCDDDSYVHVNVVSELDLTGVDYAGRLMAPVWGLVQTWHFGRCRDKSREVRFEGPFPALFAEGFGYFVSRTVASLVAGVHQDVVDAHVLEDVFVGWCIEREGNGLVRRDLSAQVCGHEHVSAPRPGAYVRHPLAPEAMVRAHQQWTAAELTDTNARAAPDR